MADDVAPHISAQRSPTVRRPTNRVPAIEVLTTGMWSASSASNTLRAPACGRRQFTDACWVQWWLLAVFSQGTLAEYCWSIAGYRMAGMELADANTLDKVTAWLTCKNFLNRPERQGNMRLSALQKRPRRCCSQTDSVSPCRAKLQVSLGCATYSHRRFSRQEQRNSTHGEQAE